MTRHHTLLICALAACSLGGCATSERPFVWVSSLPPAALKSDDGTIHPRDTVLIWVRDHNELSGEYPVREDGNFQYPAIGDIHAAGRTATDLTEEMHTRVAALVVNPVVTAAVSKVAPIRVNVVGEVKTPASYELVRDRSVAAALAAAGWLTEFADRNRIFVVRHDDDKRIRFRLQEITAPSPAIAHFRLTDGDVVVVE